MRKARWALWLPAAVFACCAHAPAREQGPHHYSALRLPLATEGSFEPSGLEGRVTLVAFLASWCFPCLADVPVLSQLQERHAHAGLSVVAVGMDLEGARVLGPMVEQFQLPFPVLVAGEEVRGGKSPFGRITALPTYFLFDRQGRLSTAYEGVAAPATLERVIEGLLKR